MDSLKSDPPKMPDMVMCGDHPSFTKTELNAKEPKMGGKGKLDTKEIDEKSGSPRSYTRLSPTVSHTDRASEQRGRTLSEHTMKMLEAKRRAQTFDIAQRADLDISAAGNRALVQAALGSFRWPPYLLAVWVLVLVLTHALHCLVAVLERALPALRQVCQYFRAWTEERWKGEGEGEAEGGRACPLALGAATGAAYGLYFLVRGAHAVAVWAIEPLSGGEDAYAADGK